MSKVFFVTGAGRGLGTDIARAALDAGHRVVATGRDPQKVEKALGAHDDLLVVGLDITDDEAARHAVAAALERFDRIDVLVNNASSFVAGYFEEISPTQMRGLVETNMFGPMNVTRAVLPVMRAQRAGHVITLSSLAGAVGLEFCAAYSAAKFGVEGWMEALHHDVEPYGIHTTIVEPGFFRTDLLSDASTSWAEWSIDDYAERTEAMRAGWQSRHGAQPGDPAKLAAALVAITGQGEPPQRFVAGDDAIGAVTAKADELRAQAEASHELGSGLDHDDA